jgi:hypothetical protein
MVISRFHHFDKFSGGKSAAAQQSVGHNKTPTNGVVKKPGMQK